MESIPLRTLTILLNYERTAADPTYRGRKLLTTSLIDSDLVNIVPGVIKHKPASITRTHVHAYDANVSNEPSVLNSATVQVSPDINPAITSLNFQQREAIYHETRGLDGCYRALKLYQSFFELCPPNQQISIQLKNETPILVPANRRTILEFTIHNPKLCTLSTVNSKPITTVTGGTKESMHAVLGFPKPGSDNVDIVVDMTRMQYGEAGRGLFGEIYWLGTVDQYLDAAEKICGKMVPWGSGSTHVGPSEHDELLEGCAQRVWERWLRRNQEGWCDYCGVGGNSLLKCSGCVDKSVWYCCKQHQVAAWKQHKWICEKKKK